MGPSDRPLLEMEHVSVDYRLAAGLVHAVQDVNLRIARGSTVGLVGESGCGKSTLGRAILRVLPENAALSGSIRFGSMDLATIPEKSMRDVRGRNIAMIFQDPMTRLNPLMRVRDHFLETLRAHEPEIGREDAIRRSVAVLADVRVPSDRMDAYPHELSGGMRQRIMIALSLLFRPAFLIADEPTTALDVIVEAQILEMLRSLMEEYEMAVLLITHNLALVAEFANRVAVMYAGRVVEEQTTQRLFREPLHPYTQGLLRSIIDLETTQLSSIPGSPPSLLGELIGCPFYPRCEKRMDVCKTVDPPLQPLDEPDRKVACHLY